MSKKNYYFNNQTQDKIKEYQEATSRSEKEKIYVEYIMPAFDELVTKLISVYKYNASNEDMNHLKNDCITFLFETIRKWDASKGKKAFSYFNVVAKNWLTIHTRRINKNSRRSVSIHESDDMTLHERECLTLIDIDYKGSPEDIMHASQINGNIVKELEKLVCLLSKPNDKKCMHAIIHIFKNVEELDFFNKRAVFVYLREISGLNSSELSSSLSRIRRIWKKNNLEVSLFF